MRKNIPTIIFIVTVVIGFTSYYASSPLKKTNKNDDITNLTKLAGIIRSHNKIMHQHNLIWDSSMKRFGRN